MPDMNSAQKSVFIAYTPYHVFIAWLMALNNRSKNIDHQLVIFSNFADAKVLYDSLLKFKSLPFSKVVLLKGEYGYHELGFIKRGYARFIVEKKTCRELVRYVRRENFQRIFLFNEDRPSSLYLLKYVETVKDKVAISFVEDGAVTYSSFLANKPSGYLFLGKLFYGSWWRNVQVMGTSDVFDSVWVLFPEHVRDELKHKKLERISTDKISEIKNDDVAAILGDYGLDAAKIKRLNCIMLLSHSSVINKFPDYKATLLKAVERAKELGYTVAIKYHPRDNGDFLDLSKDPRISCLRSSVPLEFIFLCARDSLRLVVADMSTVPLTAKLMLPKAQVVSTGVLIGSKDERFLRMLNSLGVNLPKTFEELNSCIA
jgi:hypothetical protein